MTRDELLALIDQAAREGWTELDLRDEEITELPPEIGRLTQLEKLSIGRKDWVPPEKRNPLTKLPQEISQLTNLQELCLWSNQLIVLPPEIGQLTSLQSLDLGGNRLTALPPEIGQLTSLQHFYLGGNQLTAVSPEIIQLTNLQSLDLRGNRLTALPPDTSQLTNLQSLGLAGNQLTTLPPEIGQLTGLQSLDLRSNRLTALPPEIGRLANLESLDLYFNQLMVLPPEIVQLTNLQSLDLRSNRLTVLPLEITQLTGLQSLDLRSNQLTALSAEIGQLTSLQSLNLNRNHLTVLPPKIGQLTNLQRLDLRDNRLTTVPSEIGQLASLQQLDLRGNHLTTIPLEIGRLRNLQQLSFNNNQLVTVPSEIGQLSSLQTLDLSKNRLTGIPSEIRQLTSLQSLNLKSNCLTAILTEIGQLTNLQQLDLSGNKLTTVIPEISQLINLQSFNLGGNQLTTVPVEIGQLIGLQWLNLAGNRLTTVSLEIGQLTNLQWLNLSNNRLTTLTGALRHLEKLTKLHLYRNPLPVPPELLGDNNNPGDPQTILDAYFQESRPLHEAKLLLVGEGKVGKTSLVERLLWDWPPSDSGKTIGVDIHQWKVGNSQQSTVNDANAAGNPVPSEGEGTQYAINVWDFGGQDIYHTTHQFFLTHRSLYLVVLESRKDESANRLEYWLRHVQSFAGDAPIIIVANKSDQHRMILDGRGLVLKYPTIQAIIHTSCVTGEGIPQLRQVIETALAAMPHINDWIPLTWFAVKENLAALAKQKDYLTYENYTELCITEGIQHGAAQRTLARFLHDLGTALNFQDDRRLAGTNVLNPEWVTGGIYHILNADFLQGQGILRLRDLDKVLDVKRYPHHKQPFLLDIMHKFELCVPMGDGRRYLIPGLLPKERPDFEWQSSAATALEYRYAILPAAVLTRLMVRLHHHTWSGSEGQPVRWRNGLVLIRDGCRALVVADPAAARLTIALDGPVPHRRQLLSAVRTELAEIHASFAKLDAEEWVPIPDKPGAAIQYRALLNLEARSIFTHYDPGNDVEIDVPALLDGIETQAERDVRVLVLRLIRQFDKAKLRHLAFELQVDHEDLPGETKMDLARELALHCQRRGRLDELERVVGEKRPFLH
jgi:small GTP-binding protein